MAYRNPSNGVVKQNAIKLNSRKMQLSLWSKRRYRVFISNPYLLQFLSIACKEYYSEILSLHIHHRYWKKACTHLFVCVCACGGGVVMGGGEGVRQTHVLACYRKLHFGTSKWGVLAYNAPKMPKELQVNLFLWKVRMQSASNMLCVHKP